MQSVIKLHHCLCKCFKSVMWILNEWFHSARKWHSAQANKAQLKRSIVNENRVSWRSDSAEHERERMCVKKRSEHHHMISRFTEKWGCGKQVRRQDRAIIKGRLSHEYNYDLFVSNWLYLFLLTYLLILSLFLTNVLVRTSWFETSWYHDDVIL